MKKHLLFLFTMLLPLVASAQKVEIDGIWYNLMSEGKQAEVTFKGDYYYSYDEYSGSITIPATVTYNGVTYSVTRIGNTAFYNSSSLTAITIPEGVTSIGNSAFNDCSSLTAITCHAVTPPTITSYTFKGVDKGIPVYVPAGSVEAYKEAKYWSEFTNYVGIEAGIDKSQLTTGSEQLTIYDLRGRRVTDTERGGIYIVGGKKVIIK